MSAWKPFLRQMLARWLKVPPEPQAPAGSPGTVRVFRASERYFRLKQAIWFGKQLLLVAFAIVFAVVLHHAWVDGRIRLPEGHSLQDPTVRWVAGGVLVLHLLPLIIELISMPFTYALAWLDYDQRWYITTDRSLRIREGVWRVREMTLTFANIQQMTIRQNPIQRVFGISDLVVTTAGGGSGGGAGGIGEPGHHGAEPVHTGVLRGVEKPEELRDWILQRMQSLKDSGLGDPDDLEHRDPFLRSVGMGQAEPVMISGPASAAVAMDMVHAARSLAEEARALRRVLDRETPGTSQPPTGQWTKM